MFDDVDTSEPSAFSYDHAARLPVESVMNSECPVAVGTADIAPIVDPPVVKRCGSLQRNPLAGGSASTKP